MAYSLVAHVGKKSTDNNGITTDPIDTSGASLLVVAKFGPGILSDSKGNTWSSAVTAVGSFSGVVEIWYAVNPIVGAGHTFTVTGTSTGTVLCVQAWAGAATSTPLDQTHARNGAPGAVKPGPITPSQDNCLVVTAAGAFMDGTLSIDASYTISDQFQGISNQNWGGGMADIVQTTATVTDPTWTNSGSFDIGSVIASFLASAASGSPPVRSPNVFTLGGVC